MSGSRILIAVLLLLLVASNGLWAYSLMFPEAPPVKAEYRCSPDEHLVEISRELVGPLTAAIAASAKPGATKQDIVAAATNPSSVWQPVCIQGADVIVNRRVGLFFDTGGNLVNATTNICIN